MFQKGFSQFEEDFRVIQKDVTKGRTDFLVFNYSVREFLCKIQGGISKENSRQNIANVLTALMPLFPDIGYCQGMNYIVALLLCFLDEENCFLVMYNLLANILPEKFYNKTLKGLGLLGLSAEKDVLFKYIFIDCNQTFSKRQDFVIQFFEVFAPQFLLTLCSNIFNIETFFYLIDKVLVEEKVLFLKKFAYVERAIMCMLVYVDRHTEEIDIHFISEEITREMNKKFLMTYMNNFQIDMETRKQYYEDFIKQFSSKWARSTKSIIIQIEDFTKFNQEEILLLQTKFQSLKQFGKKEFMEFMKTLYKDETLKAKTLVQLSEEELSKLFDQFDDDKSGSLDFREFLCCLSLMTRGTLKEKLEMIFKIFDNGKKGFLTQSEAFSLLEFCAKSFCSSDTVSVTKDEAKEFEQRWRGEFSRLEKVTLIEVFEIQKDRIFNTIQEMYSNLRRRDTARDVIGKLESLN